MCGQEGGTAASPFRDAIALRRQAVKRLAPSPQKYRNPELELELLDAAGKAGLCNVAPLGRAAEMALLGHRHQIAELLEVHVRPFPGTAAGRVNCSFAKNVILD
jgi:hypothetical protein